MIAVRLCGGLGNQLFQYAAALRLATLRRVSVGLDLSFYERPAHPDDTPRSFELSSFPISGRPLDRNNAGPLQRTLGSRWRRAAAALTGRLAGHSYIKECGAGFDPRVLEAPDNSFLVGYWQSRRYFHDIEPLVRRELAVSCAWSEQEAPFAERIARGASVAIHVRRGDYVSNPRYRAVFAACSREYYVRAAQSIAASIPDCRFFVFSDDPQWAFDNLSSVIPADYVGLRAKTRSIAEFALMTGCDHHIIANSTFSWWAAWLGTTDTQRVIAPRRWFTDARINTRDLLPATWTRL